MVTLSKRATQHQLRIMKVVQGAVKNVAHHHPEYGLTEQMARSIAKRAAGTLSAQEREVLAAKSPSDSRAVSLTKVADNPSQGSQADSGPPSHRAKAGPMGGGRRNGLRRSPLLSLHKTLGVMAGWARKAGHLQRAAAFEDALRIVARHMGDKNGRGKGTL